MVIFTDADSIGGYTSVRWPNQTIPKRPMSCRIRLNSSGAYFGLQMTDSDHGRADGGIKGKRADLRARGQI